MALLCAIVMFATVNSMKFKADTLERTPTCGYPDHVHDAECYDAAGDLVCERHVHTDACYQQRPGDVSVQTSSKAETQPIESASVELAELELAAAQGEEGLGDLPEEEPLDDTPIQESAPEPEYTVGEAQTVLLSEILEEIGLEIDDVVDVAQVLPDEDSEILIQVERQEDDFVITLLHSFDEIELAIITNDDILLVKLIDAEVEEATMDGEDEDDGADDLTDNETDDEAFAPIEIVEPTIEATLDPSQTPMATEEPSVEPTNYETEGPAEGLTEEATVAPSLEPSIEPTEEPAHESGEETETMPVVYEITVDLTDKLPPYAIELEAETSDEWTFEYDETVISVEEIDGVYCVVPLTSFERTVLLVHNDREYAITLENCTLGVEALDLGLAVIRAQNGEHLPEEAAGHASILQGDAADEAMRFVEAFMAEQSPVKQPIQIKKVGIGKDTMQVEMPKDTTDQTRFQVFDIALENVDENALDFHVDITLPNAIAGKDFHLYHVHEGEVSEIEDFEKTSREVGDVELLSGFSFNTENFSQFVLTYTVDFEYNGYAYSIHGESSITLSTLFEKLGIAEDAAEAEKVAFSDETLLRVEKIEGDWLLTSLLPFQSEETLTVTMKNGDVITIDVTDAINDSTAVALTLDARSTLSASKTEKYFSFTAPYDHAYQFAFSNLLTARTYTFVLYDADETAIETKTFTGATSTNITWELEAGKKYYIGVTRSGSGSRSTNATPTLVNHVYESHVCTQCGEIQPWYIDEDGTLHICSDKDVNYTSASSAPWYSRSAEIKKIVVEDGVTKIPQNFVNSTYTNLTEVEIADTVTSIGSSAFSGCTKLTSIDLGEGVESIGASAFSGCTKLTSVDIPDSMKTIGDSAFSGCTSLEAIDLGEGVESIGTSAFDGCSRLESVDVPGSVNSIGNKAFANCTSLEEARFDNKNLMTSLPDGIFQGCSALSSVLLPQDLQTMGSSAFSGCAALEKIDLPRALKTIGDGAFQNCSSLAQADLPANLEKIGANAFSGCAALEEVSFPKKLSSIGNEAYKGCASLAMVTVPNNVKELGDGVFQDCTGLEAASLKDMNIDVLPANTFSGCTSMTELQLPKSITQIGEAAFNGCTSMTEFDLPDGITVIGEEAFKGCTAMTEIDLLEGITEIGNSAFRDCTSITKFDLPDGITQIGDSVFNGCTAMTEIDLPDGITQIGDSAFSRCSALQTINGGQAGNIVLPDTLTSIGKSAFQGCNAFTSVVVPESVTSLGDSVFTNCAELTRAEIYAKVNELPASMFHNDSKLTTVILENQLQKKIPNNMFNGCTSLTEFPLWEGLEEIGANAFSGCTKLNPIVNFPASLTKVGDSAYYGCTQLTELHFADGERDLTIGNKAFTNSTSASTTNSNLKVVELPKNVTSIGDYAFNGSINAVFNAMPERLTKIGNYAFYRCDQITELNFPASLTTIGNRAFSGNSTASKLSGVTFADDSVLTTIGEYAFYAQAKLKEISIPDTVTSIGQRTFYNCKALENVKLSEGLTTLSSRLFYGCASLKEIDIPDNVKTISTNAFYNCTNLEKVDFPEKLTSIGTYAFQNCNQLQEAILPDSVTTISDNAFSNDYALKTVRIPKGTTSITSTAFNNCKSLENVIWDVPSKALTVPTFSSMSPFTLTLGKNVDSIALTTLKTLKDRGAVNLAFEGENYLTLPATSSLTLPRPLNNLDAGEYFADENGALYAVKDGTATLVYVPDGLTSYTIPATIPGKDGADPVPVTRVKDNALAVAQALTELTVEAPEAITKLDAYAFAYAKNLESVNGVMKEKEAEALFTNATKGHMLFYDTKLVVKAADNPEDNPEDGDLVYDAKNNEQDRNANWSDKVKVTIQEKGTSVRSKADGTPWTDADGKILTDGKWIVTDPGTNTYLAYTGEPVTADITISNPDSTEISGGEKIRVYFRFDNGGSTTYKPGHYEAEIKDGDGQTWPVEIVSTDAKGVYYCEFDRPTNGQTISFPVEMSFPSPNSAGGNVDIWAEFFSKEEAEATAGQARVPASKHHTVNWTTRPNDFELTKVPPKGKETIGVSVDENGTPYVDEQSYEIKLGRIGDTLQGKGRDNMQSAEFVDVMTLPEGVVLNPKIIEEIRQNKITYSGANTSNITISSPTYGTIFTFTITGGSAQTRMPELSVDEQNRPCLTWRLVNGNANLNGSGAEIDAHKVTVKVHNRVLQVKGESRPADDPYVIHNDVNVTEHFSYSADKTDKAGAVCNVNASGAKLTMKKTATNGYRGESSPYTISLSSTGIAPITNKELTKLTDVIDSSDKMHYIDAKGIWAMFTKGQYPDALELKIDNATLYGGQKPEVLAATKQNVVITTDGSKKGYTDQENTSYETSYSGASASDEHAINNNKFRFWREEGVLHYELKNSNGTVAASGTLDSSEAIQAMFDEQGFFVTRNTQYTVEWDFAGKQPDLSIPGGTTVVIDIPTRLKDSFMHMTGDCRQKDKINDEASNAHSNSASAQFNGNTMNASASSTHEQDLSMGKGVSFVESHTYSDENNDELVIPDVVEYTLNSTHIGDTWYEVMPVTDHMTLKQTLLVPVEKDNKNESWANGLSRRTVDDVEYFVLNRPGTYEHVWTGDAWAHRVEVTANDNESFDTKIWWYIPNYGGNNSYTIRYKAAVTQNKIEALHDAYNLFNETWLGDHEAHRLWDVVDEGGIVEATPLVTDWSKKIVGYDGDTSEGYDFSTVTKGNKVIYRFMFENVDRHAFTIKGSQLYDDLPQTRSSSFKWSKENIKLHYVGFDTVNEEKWEVTKSDSSSGYRQQIRWDDSFSMTCNNPNGIGYIYVEVDFPGEQMEWEDYAQKYGGTTLDNTLHLMRNQRDFEEDMVTHDLADHLRLRLQKGVYATGGEKSTNGADVYNSGVDSRLTYSNDDTMRREVYYYITLHNDSYTNLYLTPLQDILPMGFTFNTASVVGSSYAAVTGEKMTGVTYVTTYGDYSKVKAETEELADGRQKVTMELIPYYKDSYNNYRPQYNERLKKYYLKPGEAIVILVKAYTNGVEDHTPEVADNMVVMPVFDFYNQGADLDKGSSTSVDNTANKGAAKNDGGCEPKDTLEVKNLGFDTEGETAATEWLFSNVEVRKGTIQPGIVKSVLEKVMTNSEGRESRQQNPITVNPADKLLWGVTTMNSGVNSITDYVITDVLPTPHQFSGKVTFQQSFNSSAQSTPITIFTIDRDLDTVEGKKVVSDRITITPYGSDTPVSYTLGGEPVQLQIPNNNALTRTQKPLLTIEVKLDPAPEGTEGEVLSVRFVDKELCIPTGGSVSLNYETKNLTNRLVNKLLINTAFVTPLQQQWEGNANEGNVVNRTTPFSTDMTKSVRNSTQIAASYGGESTSTKEVKQRDKGSNKTTSENPTNWITLPDQKTEFVYTLKVTHTYPEAFRKLVLIDNLPEPDDHTAFQTDNPRNSAFKVLFSEQPDFKLTVVTENGKKINVPEDKYWFELSGKTTFDADDWSGNSSTDWTRYDVNKNQTALLETARSLRVVFVDEAPLTDDPLFPQKATMSVSFAAKIDPKETNDVQPGTIAWNSFGYHYTRKGSTTDQEAAPLLVGVRVPDYPSVSKTLVNARLKPHTAEEDETFTFVLYEGDAISTIPGTLTGTQIEAEIQAKHRNYVKVTVTVPSGQDASSVSASFDKQKGYMYVNGAYQEEVPWVMKDKVYYNLVELPSENYEAYAYKGTVQKSYRFQYNLTDNEYVINSVNMHDDWSFRLNKVDQFGTVVGGPVFAVYTPVQSEKPDGLDSMTLEALNAKFGTSLEEMPARTQEKDKTTYYLKTVFVMPGNGHYQLDNLSGSSYLYQELTAADQYHALDSAVYKVERNEADKFALVTESVVNQYEANGTASIEASKSLYGRPLEAGEFTFKIEGFDLNAKSVITDQDKMPPMPAVTEVSNNAEGEIRFGDIPLAQEDIGKTYCYQISEIEPPEGEKLDKVVYDQRKYLAKLRVSDLGEGNVGGTVTYSYLDDAGREHTMDSAVFHNRYEFETSVDVNIQKVMTGMDWNENDSFEFVLESVADENGVKDERTWQPQTIVSTTNDHKATFTLNYNQDYAEQTWHYRLTETIPDEAVAYSTKSGLAQQVPPSIGSKQKTDLTYALYKKIKGNSKDTRLNGLDESDFFWKYKGLSYDWTTYAFSVRLWYDAATKTVMTEMKRGNEEWKDVTFKNSYVADNTEVSIPVCKIMDGRPLRRDEKFTFLMVPENGSPEPKNAEVEVERDSVGANFGIGDFTISYSWENLKKPDGTYADRKEFWYTVYEKIDENAEGAKITRNPDNEEEITEYYYDQVTYDLHKERVKVTLIDNKDGTMRTEVTYASNQSGTSEGDADGSTEGDNEGVPLSEPEIKKPELSFVNKYKAEPIGFPVTVEKHINGGAVWGDRSYQFKLYDSEDKVVTTLTVDHTGSVTQDIPEKLGEGTYSYYLKEVIPDNASAEIDGNTVQYKDADDEQKADATLVWKLDSMTYDSSRQDITVTVEADKLTYRLEANVKYADTKAKAAVFNNGYEAQGVGEVQLSKRLTGREFTEGEKFTFELIPQDGAPLRTSDGEKSSLTVEVGKDQTVAFDQLIFDVKDLANTEAKDFTYLVGEQIPEAAIASGDASLTYVNATDEQKQVNEWIYQGVTYAKAQTVTLHVADDGTGHLVVTYGENGTDADPTTLEFENQYKAESTSFDLKAEKQILDKAGHVVEGWKIEGDPGNDWSGKTFSFRLDPEAEATEGERPIYPPMPADSLTGEDGKQYKVVTVNQEDKTQAFGAIPFEYEGTYRYTISEMLPKEGMTGAVNRGENLIYDTTRYHVTVTVSDDGLGQLKPTVTYAKDSNSPSALNADAPLTFQNREFSDEKEFTFSKVWKDSAYQTTAWPDDRTITVKLYSTVQGKTDRTLVATLKLNKKGCVSTDPANFTVVVSSETADNVTTFTLSKLKRFNNADELLPLSYSVEEETLPGYQAPGYTSSDVTSQVKLDVTCATDGMWIINAPEASYELPSTGGPGTRLFTIIGSILILGAGALLLMKRRRLNL